MPARQKPKHFIQKLKDSRLTGRGGAGFPTWKKWQCVAEQKAEKKYVICNCAEGDPNTKKDGYLLEHNPQNIVDGVKLAIKVLDADKAYIYLRRDYYQKYPPILKKLIGDAPINFFEKPCGYLCGEETVLLNAIEKQIAPNQTLEKPLEPRRKPPYPPESGLFGQPTLINNCETFYHIANIAKDNYKKTRFFTLSGDCANPGVYELAENYTVKQILKETKNLPEFDFFVQAGAGICGEILLADELDKQPGCLGSIKVFDKEKTDPYDLLNKWANFFMAENCDKCTPCREGVFRIAEIVADNKLDKDTLNNIFYVMEETSFCALGKAAVTPFRSLIEKLKL